MIFIVRLKERKKTSVVRHCVAEYPGSRRVPDLQHRRVPGQHHRLHPVLVIQQSGPYLLPLSHDLQQKPNQVRKQFFFVKSGQYKSI